MRAFRFALFALVLALLSACDAGEPEGETDPIIGEWTQVAYIYQRILVTVNQTQQIVDRMRPGTGDLRFTGDAHGDFRYAVPSMGRDGREILLVSTLDPYVVPFPSHRAATMKVNELGMHMIIGNTWYRRDHAWGERPFALEDGVLTLEAITLEAIPSGSVTVSGTLTMPLRTLEAGVEAEVEQHLRPVGEEETGSTYVFGRDDSFEIRRGTTDAGTWERVDAERVRATVIANGDPVTFDWIARMEGDQLYLGSEDFHIEPEEPACERPNCFEPYERRYALTQGSLARVRQEYGKLFFSAGERP